jgi:hypothetical protein
MSYFSDYQVEKAIELFASIDNRNQIESFLNETTYTFKTPVVQEGEILSVENGTLKVDYDGEIEFEHCSDFETADLIELFNAIKENK